jgi:hydroxymethylbilane synthase
MTKGDKDKTTPLTLQENSGFFTHEIEQDLLKRKIDIAIHSAKDLEQEIPSKLRILATTKSISPFDCLVASKNITLDKLRKGSLVGVSSKNRQEAIINYRRDLKIGPIRGNIDERIRQLDNGRFDAIIVAHAALIRLSLESRISQIIPFDIIKPDPLQGKLAIQARKDQPDLVNIFRRFNEN